ncbi:MAG: TetR/AcrR family transcriptional regulator [Anaerolineales bacterium]
MSDKRNDILQATLKLISEHGFHDAPMSKIAAEANVGAGTIYRYFEDKEALINELFLELKQEISMAMLVGFSSEKTLEEQFRVFWLNTFNYCIQRPREMLFIEQYHNSPFLTPETEAQTMRLLAPIVEAIQKGVEQDQLKPLPFIMLSAFTSDVAFTLAKNHVSGALEMDEAHLELALQACWEAIRV